MADFERIRLVILGGAGVGKSCIVKRFLFKTYSDKYRATVEDLYNREYDIGGVTLKVNFIKILLIFQSFSIFLILWVVYVRRDSVHILCILMCIVMQNVECLKAFHSIIKGSVLRFTMLKYMEPTVPNI